LQAIIAAAPVSIADVIDIDREVREKAREFMPLPTS
jgi:spermidine synthase